MSGKRKRADGLPENPLEGLPLTGALSKQVADSTVVNQLPPKEGGAIKRAKPTSLGVLIEAGVIKDGAVLRYMKETGPSYRKLMAVGFAKMNRAEVHGNSSLLGMSSCVCTACGHAATTSAEEPCPPTWPRERALAARMQLQALKQAGCCCPGSCPALRVAAICPPGAAQHHNRHRGLCRAKLRGATQRSAC